MIYTTDRIIEDVRICIDQNPVGDALINIGDVDTLSLDRIIHSKIEQGARAAMLAAPVHLLEAGHNFGDSVYWDNNGSGETATGYIVLPADFLRLVVFEMDDWEQPVYNAIGATDDAYQLQRSRYCGVRGTPQHPVCALGIRPEGKVLEFYSCLSDDATVIKAVYVPEPRIDRGGGVEISERCYAAAVYAISALVYATYGDNERAAAMNELAKTSLQ